jgi:hypothetical protein
MPDVTYTQRPPVWFWGILVSLIGLQLFALLIAGVPSKLGFQMFAGKGYVVIVVSDPSGNRLDVDPELIPRLRVDTDWTTRLPEYLCTEVSGAAEVTVSQHHGSRTVTC